VDRTTLGGGGGGGGGKNCTQKTEKMVKTHREKKPTGRKENGAGKRNEGEETANLTLRGHPQQSPKKHERPIGKKAGTKTDVS